MTEQPKSLIDAVEAKIREVDAMVADGVLDWSDADEELLTTWRRERGEAGMSDTWEWWSMPQGEGEYQLCGPTRDDVIRQGKEEFPGDALEVIEVRYWSDDIRPDEARFAQMRNHEVLADHLPRD